MKKVFSLIIAFFLIISVFISMPTAQATEATELFKVTTDGFSCNGTISYIVYLKQGVSFSGASIRFKYDDSFLEVVECEPFMVEDDYGDPIENIPGIYESGEISGFSDVYGIIFMHGVDNDYYAKTSDKAFVEITFKLKDNVFLSPSETTVDICCYEFVSYDNPRLNIFNGKEKVISTLKNMPKEHSFTDNVCSSCGCVCFEYIKNESGITITKYNGRKSVFEVPSTLNSLTVTGIGNGNSPICANFIEISLPQTIKSIGANVFYGTHFYNNPSNWKNGALYTDNFLIDTNENLPLKYYVDNSIVIADEALHGYSGYLLCEKGSDAYKYALLNGTDFIIPTITSADNNSTVDFPNQLIFTSVLKCNDAENIISIPENMNIKINFTSPTEKFLGTGSTFTIYDQEDYMGDYTLITEGDLDGDGVCDAIDAYISYLYSADFFEPTQNQIYAANGAIADGIDFSDYQNIVNISLKS